MYTKRELYNDIVQIMKTDYAGFLDKKHVNHAENYLVTEEMTDEDFVKTVQSYLLDFKDPHLIFRDKKAVIPYRGFKVRRYENALYVTEVTEEASLQIGDIILKIDGLTIEEFERNNPKILKDHLPERQYWDEALKQAIQVFVNRNDKSFLLNLSSYERPSYEPDYIFERIDFETVYIKITDFSQSEPIQDLINSNKSELSLSKNLIIDVRVNIGGNDLFYLPILDFVFEQEIPIKNLFQEDEIMFTNFTERNCQLWIKALKDYLNQELESHTQIFIQKEISKFNINYGKGLLVIDEEFDYMIHGQTNPKHVFVLSDVTCSSSGETFVQNVKKSPKVTVVGRPTMGSMDYCNVVTVDYNDYKFTYSTSKLHEKYHYNNTGAKPHVYIPWSPQHLKEDVDLNYVLMMCRKNSLKS